MPTDMQLRQQAYLDDQLGVAESLAFLATVPSGDQSVLQGERAFNAAVADRLAEPQPCPEAIWARLRRELATPIAGPRLTWWQRPLLLRLAAGLAVTTLACWGLYASSRQPVRLTDHLEVARTVAQLAAQLDLTGNHDQIVAALQQSGFALPLHAPTAADGDHHHGIKLVGLRIFKQGQDCVAQLGYVCCGQPITVYITRQNATCLPREVDARHLPSQWCLGAQQIGEYRIVAVGPHETRWVLGLFS